LEIYYNIIIQDLAGLKYGIVFDATADAYAPDNNKIYNNVVYTKYAGYNNTSYSIDIYYKSQTNLFKNNIELLARLGPRTGIKKHKNFIPRIKPLYFVSEKEVIDYSRKNKFPVNYNACPCRADAYRNHIRKLLDRYEKKNPNVKKHIINGFLQILPGLKKDFQAAEEPMNCRRCNEPSKNKICMACQILEKLR